MFDNTAQLCIFDQSITKLQGYEHIVNNNRRERQQDIVLSYIDKTRPITRQDLSTISNLPLASVCGRINELIKLGWVKEEGSQGKRGLLIKIKDFNNHVRIA